MTDEKLLVTGFGDHAAGHVERTCTALAADDKIAPGVEHRATAEVKRAVGASPLPHVEILV